MILHNLTVANWRSLLTSVSVGPFSERLNVIHAPNGTGKSSLFEALRRGLFDAHLVTGVEIDAIRSWGRDLSPEVQFEFTQSGVRYRVKKTFLNSQTADLARFEDGRFQPLANSRNADIKLREIMAAADAPGRGLSKHEHWGLAEVLWAPQGSLRLDSLSSNVTQNLRAALGVQLAGEGGSRLEEELEKRYATYFTNAGKLRTGKQAAPILGLQAELETALVERKERLEQHQRFEETSRAVEDARQKRNQTRHEADAIREAVGRTRQQAESYAQLRRELEQKRLIERTALERFEAIGQSLELIQQARQEITQHQSAIQRGGELMTELAAELKRTADAADTARAQRDQARAQRPALDERAAEVEDARAYVADNAAHQELAARLARLKQFDADLRQQKELRLSLVAPDAKTIREVRKHTEAGKVAKAAIDASLIHLTVQPKKKTSIHRESPDETQVVSAGDKATFSGSPEVRIEIAGFGTIHASGPAGDAETHQAALQDAERKLAKLTQPYGTLDPDRLQLLHERAKDMDQKVEQLEEKITEVLKDETADELNTQLAELDARLRERLSRFPAWQEKLPVVSDLKSALEQLRKTVLSAIETAEDTFEKAQSVAQAVEKRHGIASGELHHARLNLEGAQTRLNGLTTDGQSEATRTHARQEALMAWNVAKVEAGECEGQIGRAHV